ncbi:olfactory receptor 1019-like [Bombina bombina]|uniref:olfactory receptor 1019-like n=1 Tax=Bombina bombina TaxID=8345 RepID=UPI00235AB329|nr:olfactory receptor 1019-like [Bombina bombina]
MASKNESIVKEFILLGLSSNPQTQIILFVVFSLIYLFILIGNFLFIAVCITHRNLQTPMYFFIANLSLVDICYSSSIVPRMLKDFLSTKKSISFQECATQMYMALSLGEAECILLAIMAYDRYVAICYPLRYTTIINRSVCVKIVISTWICGFLIAIPHVGLTMKIKLCGNNKINHFVCEFPGLVALGCGDLSAIELFNFVACVVVLTIPVTFITTSYILIISAILKITSSAGKQKAISTCGSHLTAVTLFYGSAMTTYMKPKSSSSSHSDMIIAVFYTIITPMLNPLIYTLRNEEVKTALQKTKFLKIRYIFPASFGIQRKQLRLK